MQLVVKFPAYDIKLLEILKKEQPAPIICFYGGEPLVRRHLIAQAIDILHGHATFVLQTNGTLLDTLEDKYLHALDTILVSIDGDAAETDRNRGKGTYGKVVAQVRKCRERGFKGDLIARMTVSDGHNIEPAVKHLLELGLFDHVHWQLDVLWDSPMFARWDDFLGWRDNNYNPGITKLAHLFKENLEKGKVLGIAPFLGILWSLLNNQKITHIRCSAGYKGFNLTTGGQVTACPIAPEFNSLGDLSPSFDPKSVHGAMSLGEKCLKCDILDKCGGRCLYANHTDWWGEEGFAHVCQTVRYLIKEMEEMLPHAKKAIEEKKVKLEDFHYPRYNNTVETIP